MARRVNREQRVKGREVRGFGTVVVVPPKTAPFGQGIFVRFGHFKIHWIVLIFPFPLPRWPRMGNS